MPAANPPDLARLIAVVEALARETARLRGDVGKLRSDVAKLLKRGKQAAEPPPAVPARIESTAAALAAISVCSAKIRDCELHLNAMRSALRPEALRAEMWDNFKKR